MAAPGRQRLRIANLVGAGIWISLGIIGPPLLGLPPLPFQIAVAVNAGWETLMVLLTLRSITLVQVWALAVITTTHDARPRTYCTRGSRTTIGVSRDRRTA